MPLTEEERKERKRASSKRYDDKNRDKKNTFARERYRDNVGEERKKSKDRYLKNMNDPAYREKRRQLSLDYYNKKKNDPEFKEKIKLKTSLYRKKNRELLNDKQKKYHKDHLHDRDYRANQRDIKRRCDIKANSELADSYVKRRLTAKSPLTAKNIPQSLIEAKRLELLMKRFIKEQENE